MEEPVTAPPLRLFVFSTEDEFDDALPSSAMSPADCAASPPPWSPRLDETLLWLDGARDPLVMSPLGRLEAIAPQLEEAATRLEAGQRALLRSASDSTAVFLVIEPAGDGNEVAVAQLATPPEPWGSYYPLEHSFLHLPAKIDQRAALYDYVEAHRGELVTKSAHDGQPFDRLHGLRWKRDAAIEALRREATGARALLTKLTRP